MDGNNTTTTYTYDALNRKKSAALTVSGKNQTTGYTYDKNGNLLQETNWRSNSYTYTYDPLNRLIEKKDPNNTRIEKLTYNNNHLQISSQDALNQTTYFTYDRNNRKLSTTNPLGHTVRQSYNNIGHITGKTDARGNTTGYTYNNLGQLIQVTDQLNQTTTYTYDHQGNLLTQTDPLNQTTEHSYNARNLIIDRTDPAGLSETYQYTAAGELSLKTDRNGIQTNYTYDIHNRLITENAGGEQKSYTYDNNNNIRTLTDSTGSTGRTYDQLNRVISKTVPQIGTATYQYDQTTGLTNGRINEITTDPKGNITTKTIDKAGRLYQVKMGSAATTYTYNANGTRAGITYPNSVSAEYTYDAANQLKTLTNKSGNSILEAYAYQYDAHGNLSSKTDLTGVTGYTYDRLNRLAGVTDPSGKQTGYTFDGAGNRSEQTIVQDNQQTVTTYTYNQQNRLENYSQTDDNGTQTRQYAYDPNGNLIQSIPDQTTTAASETGVGLSLLGIDAPADSGAVNTYDNYNQLIITQQDGHTTINTYNGEGYRVEKITTQEGITKTSRYLYEYDKIVLEVNQNNQQIAFNLYGANLISRTVENQTLYYHYNGHGDVTGLTNSNGIVVASYYYDAFGNITSQTGDSNNPFRYAGYQYDTESNLYYLNSRFYDAGIARFLQEDTYRGSQTDPLSLNLYTYCNNEPLMYYDPSGHSSVNLSYSIVWNRYGEMIGTTNGKSYTDTSSKASAARPPADGILKPWVTTTSSSTSSNSNSTKSTSSGSTKSSSSSSTSSSSSSSSSSSNSLFALIYNSRTTSSGSSTNVSNRGDLSYGYVWNKHGEIIGTTNGLSYTDRSLKASETRPPADGVLKPWVGADFAVGSSLGGKSTNDVLITAKVTNGEDLVAIKRANGSAPLLLADASISVNVSNKNTSFIGTDVIIANWVKEREGSTYWDPINRTITVDIYSNKTTFQEGQFYINPGNDRAYMNDIKLRALTNPTLIATKKIPPKTVAGVKGGASALADSYGLEDALGSAALAPAVAYDQSVKSGIIKAATPLAKTASKLVPGAGALVFVSEILTFGGGFIDGWNEYE